MDNFVLNGPIQSRSLSPELRCTLRNLTLGALGTMRGWMDSELECPEVENTVFTLHPTDDKSIIAGWAQLHYNPWNSEDFMHDDCVALSIFVDANWRGMGAGKLLVKVVTAYAKAAGKTVQIYPSDIPSRAMYACLLDDPHVINGFNFEEWNIISYEDLMMW